MQLLEIPAVDAMSMIDTHSGIENALRETEILVGYEYKNVFLCGDNHDILVTLLERGYTARDAVYAFIAAKALNADVNVLLFRKLNIDIL
jgi:hypothetical protein